MNQYQSGNQLPTNAGASMLDAISGLVPLLVGSGKTTKSGSSTTKSTSTANPAAIQALTQLLTQGTGANVKGAQQNAINLMLQQGVPSIGANERGTGIYNASQTQQAMSQLLGQTAAASAQIS